MSDKDSTALVTSVVAQLSKFDDLINFETVTSSLRTRLEESITKMLESDDEAMSLLQSDPELALKFYNSVTKNEIAIVEAKRRLMDSTVRAYSVLGMRQSDSSSQLPSFSNDVPSSDVTANEDDADDTEGDGDLDDSSESKIGI